MLLLLMAMKTRKDWPCCSGSRRNSIAPIAPGFPLPLLVVLVASLFFRIIIVSIVIVGVGVVVGGVRCESHVYLSIHVSLVMYTRRLR